MGFSGSLVKGYVGIGITSLCNPYSAWFGSRSELHGVAFMLILIHSSSLEGEHWMYFILWHLHERTGTRANLAGVSGGFESAMSNVQWIATQY